MEVETVQTDGDTMDWVETRTSEAGMTRLIDFESIIQNSGILPPGSNDSPAGVGQAGGPIPNRSCHLLQAVLPDSLSGNVASITPIHVASDDLAAHVLSSVKKMICRGEYVNSVLLLKGEVY